jgi:transposase
MGIVMAGFDVHRTQITFDALEVETGELVRGRIAATPEGVAEWVGRFPGRDVHVALEACTGWFFVSEALRCAGALPHLADPAETRARRGPKQRAKTDREDARWLRTLLHEGRLPEAWIPPQHICELRMLTRLRKTLVDERTRWLQRIHATLFHFGVPSVPDQLRSGEGRAFLEAVDLPPAARKRVEVALVMVDHVDRELGPIERELRCFAREQRGCQALAAHFGVGPLTATTVLAELGDANRLSSSRKAVRFCGLDVGVHRSDRRSRVGKLTKQGSPQLRWALFEAAQSACRKRSPDHADYLQLRERMSHTRASLTIARKLARRCFHTLRELGPEGIAPPAS